MDENCGCEEAHGHFGCCCRRGHHGHRHFTRRFMTNAEKVERLESYLKDLKNEIAAVQERVKNLKASK